MKFLVAYASTEGQTRKIARFVTDRLVSQGHTIELVTLKDAHDVELSRFDGAILAASVHASAYQRALTKFTSTHAARLEGMPTLFLSVSLAAAGHNADDWKGLDRIGEEMSKATGWTPGRTVQVAGAYKPSEYDLFRKFIMRRIMAAKAPEADPEADHEYTDWAALKEVLQSWTASVHSESAVA